MTSIGLELGEWMRQPGNLDVDLLSDAQGTLWLADVNPRFGGGYRFSDRFGARFPERLMS
jgi:carbamoyl-phosphate synthase large subunit